LTSKEKWAKIRGILEKWWAALLAPTPTLSHKELLSNQGFLVYMTCTYPAMVPYLKGFHLTIEMWHGGRNSERWKLKPSNASSLGEDVAPFDVEDKDEAAANHRILIKSGAGHAYTPEDGLTTPVPRFRDDINTLLQLTNFVLPPLRVVRPAHVVHVYYGFGDASGKHLAQPCQKAKLQTPTERPQAGQSWCLILRRALDDGGGGGELELHGAQEFGGYCF
jgi:hypothetical protein